MEFLLEKLEDFPNKKSYTAVINFNLQLILAKKWNNKMLSDYIKNKLREWHEKTTH
jgi:hypothetical protein